MGFIPCEAEDQGGYRGCPVPATLVTKVADKTGLHYYCYQHKTNRHVWREDELEPMPPTMEMVNGLVALYETTRKHLEKFGTDMYNQDKAMAEALGVPADFWNRPKLLERAKELLRLSNTLLVIADESNDED